jgi:hypothetical protein
LTERSFWRRQWDWIIGRAGRRSAADLYFGPGGMLSWMAEHDDCDSDSQSAADEPLRHT